MTAGRKAIVNVFACIDCHKFRNDGELGHAPGLTGYASREWLTAFISNPADKRFYGDKNDRMPAFAPHPNDPRESTQPGGSCHARLLAPRRMVRTALRSESLLRPQQVALMSRAAPKRCGYIARPSWPGLRRAISAESLQFPRAKCRCQSTRYAIRGHSASGIR